MNVKPLTALNQSLEQRVIVELKGGREFRGTLDGFDVHMNLVLKEVEELLNGEKLRSSALTIVRGDNVVFISP